MYDIHFLMIIFASDTIVQDATCPEKKETFHGDIVYHSTFQMVQRYAMCVCLEDLWCNTLDAVLMSSTSKCNDYFVVFCLMFIVVENLIL